MAYVDILPRQLGMSSTPGEHGYLRTIQNMRIEGSHLKVRNGLTAEIASGPGGDECLGAAIDGSGTIAVCVMKDGSEGRIYTATHNGSVWSSWTEATASSGVFGDTRLDTVDRPCAIAFLREPITGTTRIVVQNGVDEPRIMPAPGTGTAFLAGGGEVAAIGAAIEAMPDAGQVLVTNRQQTSASGYTQIKYGALNIASGTLTVAQTGGHTIATVGTSPQLGVKFTAASNVVASGDTFQIRSSVTPSAARADFLSGDQLWIAARYLVGTAAPHEPGGEKHPWLHLKIEVSADGSTWLEVYDPDIDQAIISPSPLAGSDSTGYFHLAAFDIATKAQTSAERTILAGVEYVRFTAVRTFDIDEIHIIGIASSGNAPALAQHGVTKFNAHTGIESPIRVLDAPTDGALFPLAPTLWAGSESIQPKIPIFTGLKVQYILPMIVPTQAEIEAGVVWCRAYRRDPGETEFQQIEPSGLEEYDTANAAISNKAGIQAASYSSGWAVTSWAGDYEQRALIRDNARSQERRSLRAPDAFNIGIPKGAAMAQAGSRLAIGADDIVHFSESQNPFRNSEFARPESDVYAQTRSYAVGLPDSGVAALVPADATGTLAAVYAMTGRLTVLVQGTQAQLIAERGAVGPYDAVMAEGALYLHDARKEALFIAGRTVRSLSSRLVEDDFTAGNAGRIRGSVGTLGTRVFFSVKVADAVGERVMVYDTQLGAWESRDVLPSGSGARFFQPINRNGQKLAAWLEDGSLVIYGEGADDAGTAISFLVETPDLIGSPRIAARRMAIDADSASGSLEVSTARIPVSDAGSNQTGTIDVATTGRTQATENASPPPGLAGRVMRLRLSGDLPAGWRLYRWMCDMNQRPEGWPKQ